MSSYTKLKNKNKQNKAKKQVLGFILLLVAMNYVIESLKEVHAFERSEKIVIENSNLIDLNICELQSVECESEVIPTVEAPIEEIVAKDNDHIMAKAEIEALTAEFSAYTSREEETDSSPCISADGTNICEYDGCVVATNDYPLGTKLQIENFGECIVKDRMNARYTGKGNIDIYFKHNLEEALSFGRQKLTYNLIK